MPMIHRTPILGGLLLPLALSMACTPNPATAGKTTSKLAPESNTPTASPTSQTVVETSQKSGLSRAKSARLVARTQAGRAAEILDANDQLLETLVPEDFSHSLKIPDIANNSSEMITSRVPGTDIIAVNVEQGTGRILVAVRGFIYAEVSTDLVFVLAPLEQEGPRPPSSVLPLYFDGPESATDGKGARPHLDIARVSFGPAGSLELSTADASGGACELAYDSERVPQRCNWRGGESRRCPNGLESK